MLIVDDHEGFRRAARRMLECEGFRVVGEAEDGRSAIALARRLEPELVLLDVRLPDLDGFEVAARLAEQSARPEVVLISSHELADFAPLVARSGACGFVPKDELSGAALAELLP